VNVTQFLVAHTISEVLDGLAFVVLFLAAVSRVVFGPRVTKQEAGAVR
jgi:hypothetical protein